ncbi:MAG: penicillin-binding protein 2, partial [Pseudomonadota bacterium]
DIENAKTNQDSLKALTDIIAIDDEKILQVKALTKGSRHKPPFLIKEHLTQDELAQFEFYRLNYPGIFLDIGQVRYYPFSESASHLIGYVGAVAKNEEQDSDAEELEYLPDFKIGKNGVEKMLETRLRGTAGVKQLEVNVHGINVRELDYKEGKAGEDIRLTVDSRLQEYTCARMNGESAAAVVMNIHNGDLLALASVPSYNPNSFSKGITTKYWGELNANEKNPLMNKAISGQYPPGSTFKIAMGLAALEAGVINKESRVSCNGNFLFGNHNFTCWKQGGHGSVNLHDAIMGSCDVFFYTMADRLGIDAIAEMSHRLGLGKTCGIGLSAEKPGIVPDDDWKNARYGSNWQGGDTINVGIGQGYVLTTPLQLALMTARIANGGYEVMPRLVAPQKEIEPKPLGFSEDYIRAVCDGMNSVVNSPGGTAFGKRITDERFLMAGKTGTSQVKKLIRHGMDQNKLPWEDRHHALFVGYAPVHAPKYAAAVIVEHGGGGGASAAPIVRDILLKIQSIDVGEEGPKLPEIIKNDSDDESD